MSYFTIDPGTDHVPLDETRQGSVVFHVQNKTGVARQVRAVVDPDPEDVAQEDWYSVREPLKDVGVDEGVQFPVDVQISPGVEAGEYGFRLKALAEDDPDDVHSSSQRIRVEVPEADQEGFPWWIAVIVAAVVIVGVVIWLLVRGDGAVSVPDVTGITVEAAQTQLQSAGLVLGEVTEEASTEVADGRILAQDPPAGQEVAPDSSVEVQVSSGPPDRALAFDGQDDFVSVPNTGDFDVGTSLTVEAWVQPESLQVDAGFAAIVQHARSVPPFSGAGWTMFLDDDDHSRWGLSACVPNCRSAASDGVGRLQAGQWQHVAATYDGDAIRVFRDGQLLDTEPQSGELSTMNVLLIGVWIDSFDGLIDEVRIWSEVRSPSQIQEAMDGTVPSDADGLIGYWRFNEVSGQEVTDSSDAGNDGRLGSDNSAEASDPERVPSDVPLE